jgi:hypothetical protein
MGQADGKWIRSVRESCYYKTIDSLRKHFIVHLKVNDAFVSQYLKTLKSVLIMCAANRNGNGNEASGDGFT